MKIFLFDPGMVPDYTYELATGLSEANISTKVYSGSDFGGKELKFVNFNYYSKFINVNFFQNTLVQKIIKIYLYIFFLFYFLARIRKERPDVVHLQWIRIPLIDTLVLNQFRKHTKVVLTLHNTTLNHGDHSGFISKILSYGFKGSLEKMSQIIVHTDFSKQKLLNEFPEFSNKVEVIPHGLLKFPSTTKKKIIDHDFSGSNVLLFFGNINKYKGLDLLIEAIKYLREEDLTLLIVGRPQISLGPLKDLSEELKVSDKIVWYPHFVKEENVSEIFHHAHVVVLPHRNIDQSGVLATAVFYEKPIIASNIGGFREVIENNKHGYLFENGNPKDLSKKISSFIRDKKFEVFSEEMRNLKQSWKSWDAIASDHLTLYRKTLKKIEKQNQA
jgi:glycosyltransferase involved in cell wall biosynthesis